jgi:hypothetical protein
VNHVLFSVTGWNLLAFFFGMFLWTFIMEMGKEFRWGEQIMHAVHRLFRWDFHRKACVCRGSWWLPRGR